MNAEYESLLRCCTPVKALSLDEVGFSQLKFSPQEWLKKQIRPEECWYNAYALAQYFEPHVDYVEGLVPFEDEIVEHAWNTIDGKHFDVTWEFYRPANLHVPHYKLITGSPLWLKAQGYMFMPNLLTMVEQYRRRILKETSARPPEGKIR